VFPLVCRLPRLLSQARQLHPCAPEWPVSLCRLLRFVVVSACGRFNQVPSVSRLVSLFEIVCFCSSAGLSAFVFAGFLVPVVDPPRSWPVSLSRFPAFGCCCRSSPCRQCCSRGRCPCRWCLRQLARWRRRIQPSPGPAFQSHYLGSVLVLAPAPDLPEVLYVAHVHHLGSLGVSGNRSIAVSPSSHVPLRNRRAVALASLD
jgi:hypothetical protein